MTTSLPALLAGLLAIGVPILILLDDAVTRRDRLKARLARACSKDGQGPAGHGPWSLLGRGSGLLDRLADRLAGASLLRPEDQAKIKDLLAAAGYREPTSLGRYVALKALAMVAGVLAALLLALEGVGAGQPVLQLAMACLAAFVAGLLPELALKQIVRRRRAQIRSSLADALDLMIIAANAGHSLDVALNRVGKEIEHLAPVLADEFEVLSSEMRALPNRRQALENLAQRTGLAEVKSFTATLIQTIRYGTPLTQALKTLAVELRQARIMLLEERAARLPALLSLPLMLLIMPSIFIVTVGPAIIRISTSLFE
jgi:tight adherence protein C